MRRKICSISVDIERAYWKLALVLFSVHIVSEISYTFTVPGIQSPIKIASNTKYVAKSISFALSDMKFGFERTSYEAKLRTNRAV